MKRILNFILGMIVGVILVSSDFSGVLPSEAVPVPRIQPQELECLAKTIYFEARQEPLAGKLAVGLVVLNRTTSLKYPTTVCGVIQQGRYTNSQTAKVATANMKACQFSWYCDGHSDTPNEPLAWSQAKEIAAVLLEQKVYDFTDKSTHYHAQTVHPTWANSLNRVGSIGGHTFYREAKS